MTKRSAVAVVLLSIFTFGIYRIFWLGNTKDEMNARGADVPTFRICFIPFVALYWFYRYGKGVEHVTGGRQSAGVAFLMLWLLGPIGYAILQDEFNRVSAADTADAFA